MVGRIWPFGSPSDNLARPMPDVGQSNVQLSDEARELALTVLALALAAGGKIVCRQADMQSFGSYTLTVTEDVATGDKTYEAKRHDGT